MNKYEDIISAILLVVGLIFTLFIWYIMLKMQGV